MWRVQYAERHVGGPRRRVEHVTAKLTHSLGCERAGKICFEPLLLRNAPGANLALLAGTLEKFTQLVAGHRVPGPRGMNEQDVDVVDTQRPETLVKAACRDGGIVEPGVVVGSCCRLAARRSAGAFRSSARAGP